MPVDAPVTHGMVLCHGYGAPGDDLLGLAGEIVGETQPKGIRPCMMFPEAPIDLADEGMPGGRAWWRLNMMRLMQATMAGSFDELRNEVPEGIEEARIQLTDAIGEFVERFELATVPMVLGGFSQGAMLAVETALRGMVKIPDGLVVMSGALICEELWRASVHRLGETVVFQSHGRLDTILLVETGRWLNQLLAEGAKKSDYFEFSGPHTIPVESIKGMVKVLEVLT